MQYTLVNIRERRETFRRQFAHVFKTPARGVQVTAGHVLVRHQQGDLGMAQHGLGSASDARIEAELRLERLQHNQLEQKYRLFGPLIGRCVQGGDRVAHPAFVAPFHQTPPQSVALVG
ncbi:MAG: hypothetical protein ACK4Z5_01205 [Brevundimonas sp.]